MPTTNRSIIERAPLHARCPAHACVQASTRSLACTKNPCAHAHARPHTHDRTHSLACAGYRHAHAIWTYAHRRTGRKEHALRLSWPLQEGREAGKDRTGLRERRRRIGRHGTPKCSVPLLPYCHSQSKGYCDSLLPPSLRSLSRSPDGPKVTDAFSTFSHHRPDCVDRHAPVVAGGTVVRSCVALGGSAPCLNECGWVPVLLTNKASSPAASGGVSPFRWRSEAPCGRALLSNRQRCSSSRALIGVPFPFVPFGKGNCAWLPNCTQLWLPSGADLFALKPGAPSE
jgi:hypothetical protein